MSKTTDKGFLSRWSARKAAALAPPSEPKIVEPPPDLPAIETLTAASDFTAFLARGVPSALQAQALRIAWTSDPAIAAFRGMADYDWDFNAPGYGTMAAADDVTALLGQIIRSDPARLLVSLAEPETVEPPPIEAPPAAAIAEPPSAQPEAPLVPRRHGGALPT